MEKGAGGRSGRFCYLSTTEMLGTNFPLRLTALGNGLSKLTFQSGTAGVHPANLANIHLSAPLHNIQKSYGTVES